MFIKTRPGFWKDLWALLRPYWFAEDKDTLRFFGFRFTASEKLIGRTLLVTIIALNLGLVYLSVLFNEWYRRSTTRCRTRTSRRSGTSSAASSCSPRSAS